MALGVLKRADEELGAAIGRREQVAVARLRRPMQGE